MTPCNHFFHVKCFDEWLKKFESCPICRNELTIVKLKEIFE